MILDRYENMRTHKGALSGFGRIAAFLAGCEPPKLKTGKYPLKGGGIVAVVQSPRQVGMKAARLEAHRKFIDIHYVVSGREIIGHSLLTPAIEPVSRYNPRKDIQFFKNTPQCWLSLDPGMFAVFLPHDLHAPLAGRGDLKKIVFKIEI
jgi:biofilm protein TabA